MVSSFPVMTTKVMNNAMLSALFLTCMVTVLVSPFQFQVGGDQGWIVPKGNISTESYNEWATMERFHIGDTLYFKYEEDSVLVVNSTDYQNCRTSNPIYKFDDGNTVFEFDSSGFFYFISGQPRHCKSGQRLIVRVMHPSEIEPAEEPAPSPKTAGESGGDWLDSDNWGPPAINSTSKLTLVSYFMTFLGGLIVIFYLLM